MMQFDLPKELASIIKVIGVGGGGSNAVNHMFRQGIKGVDFIVCNTDKQALDISPVPVKVQLGKTLTQGLGAGMLPEVGKNAAIEALDEIKNLLKGTKMVFITAGMGKGTGTGAAPIIAQAAKEMGILTVGIVTIPFQFEGARKRQQAEGGIEELKKHVDTLLIICNERLREIHGNLTVVNAFVHADNVLSNAARSIAEIISNTLHVNVDFNDISTVMKDSGVAVLGTASASGDGRAINAVEMALNSPLLNDNEITGARYVLMNVTSGADEITMDELGEITDYIQNAAGQTAEIVTGYGVDPNLGDKVNVTIIATGFKSKSIAGYETAKLPEKKVMKLDDDTNKKTESVPLAESKKEVLVKEENLEPVLKSELHVKEETLVPETVKQEVTLDEIASDPLEPVLIIKDTVVAESKTIIPHEEDKTSDSEETVITDEPVLKTEVPVVENTVEKSGTQELKVQEIEFEFEKAPEKVLEFTLDPGETILEPDTVEPVAEEQPLVNTPEVQSGTVEASEEKNVPVTNEQQNEEITAEEKEENVVAEEKPEVKEEKKEEPMLIKTRKETVEEKKQSTLPLSQTVTDEEQRKKAQERILRLKELSLKLKTPNGLAELENEPAYKRKNINLEDTPHSSESQVSKYTLTENEEKKVEIKPNNSFLHDNVD